MKIAGYMDQKAITELQEKDTCNLIFSRAIGERHSVPLYVGDMKRFAQMIVDTAIRTSGNGWDYCYHCGARESHTNFLDGIAHKEGCDVLDAQAILDA